MNKPNLDLLKKELIKYFEKRNEILFVYIFGSQITKKTNKFSVDLHDKEYKDYLFHHPEINDELIKNFQDFFSKKNPIKRIRDFIL